MSCPGTSDSDTAPSRSGGLTLGSSAAADATISLTAESAAPRKAPARADAMSKCGARPRYGSTSCEGNGRTTRSTSVCESPSSAEKKNRASVVIVSTSASVGTISSTRCRSAATAENSALAGGVNPETRGAGVPRRRRLAAVFNKDRNVSELEVYEDTVSDFLKVRNPLFYHRYRVPRIRSTSADVE